ncbi:uncharacterized protein BT62DRAFT_946516 [Guyanagaster necrorhizus]|uniref:Uncharacterized protein n=1 Tax=Guyanagaster necrorhizus TaxID=856835 RepID=A0A9P7VYA4_9AGAR|nr:uncharacterized protein BT62DRAFT_946516 [Guyanagaster necrorhizus MCA 3950]KAG7448823.1 hypothetical protein BT62DRAFT_946516 [Guyanagaster necrorhizus MCA 3950]
MASTLPRLDRNALVGIWIETCLWGMIAIIFIGAMFVLVRKHNSPRLLATTSTALFLFATTHVSLSLRELLEAFIDVPQPGDSTYTILYWADNARGTAVAKTILYDTSVFLQDLILIWRLYVVWGYNWKIAVLPIIVELAHMGTAYAATGLLAQPNANIDSPRIKHIGPVGWSLDLAVNVCVTAAIAFRLWYMGRQLGSSHSNRYLSTILTIVESGAIFAAVTLVMLILYVRGSELALNGIDISTQLAVMTPLLIIARVGLGMIHGVSKNLSFAYPLSRVSKSSGGDASFNRHNIRSKKMNSGGGISDTLIISTEQEMVFAEHRRSADSAPAYKLSSEV